MNLKSSVPLSIILFAVVALACHRTNEALVSQPKAALRTDYQTEQFALISAVVRDMYLDDRTHILVIEHSDPCPMPEPAEKPNPKVEEMRKHMEDDAFQEMPELARDTIDDFHSRVKECHPLAKKLDIPIKYVLVGPKDLEPLFPKGEFDRGWSRFYAKYPQSSGVISFSNPGFNRDYTQAVISTGRGCGGLCGAGYFVLLTKDHGRWSVKTKTMTWVS